MNTKPVTSIEFDDDGKFVIRQVQNDIPVVDANFVEKLSRSNGFSAKRLFRKVASIPVVAVTEAQRQGYDMSKAEDVRRFLAKNKQYLTVPGIDSGRDTRNIIK
jgi:hypothetical protein